MRLSGFDADARLQVVNVEPQNIRVRVSLYIESAFTSVLQEGVLRVFEKLGFLFGFANVLDGVFRDAKSTHESVEPFGTFGI